MEIKPQELRLTNLVEWNKEACTVQSIRGNDIGLYDRNKALICTTTKLIKPFELTPEWLERFGFEYAEGFADDYTKQPITVYNNPFKVGWTVENLFNQQIKEDILVLRYVHQIQNLFYALTGEELAIDKTSLI